MTDIKSIKNVFGNSELFDLAMTHRSWVNEHKGKRTSNERLEFLGDAILEYIVSEELYKKFPKKDEGYLTALRSNLVNTSSLAETAKKLNLGDEIFLSKGEEEGGGRQNTSLLADTVEALIGALFIDSGIKKAKKFIVQNILNDLDKRAKQPLKDPKSSLQEYVQAKGFPAPRYQVVSQIGPDHAKKFIVEVFVQDEVWGKGEGNSKASAEQEAAKNALSVLK